jgi:hypothetical protein
VADGVVVGVAEGGGEIVGVAEGECMVVGFAPYLEVRTGEADGAGETVSAEVRDGATLAVAEARMVVADAPPTPVGTSAGSVARAHSVRATKPTADSASTVTAAITAR